MASPNADSTAVRSRYLIYSVELVDGFSFSNPDCFWRRPRPNLMSLPSAVTAYQVFVCSWYGIDLYSVCYNWIELTKPIRLRPNQKKILFGSFITPCISSLFFRSFSWASVNLGHTRFLSTTYFHLKCLSCSSNRFEPDLSLKVCFLVCRRRSVFKHGNILKILIVFIWSINPRQTRSVECQTCKRANEGRGLNPCQ